MCRCAAGGGGAIDFVIHATGHCATEAIRWLAGKPVPATVETPVAPDVAGPFVPPPPWGGTGRRCGAG